MPIPKRNSIKILLINQDKELLLMRADDPRTTSKDGTYHGRFWFPIGGKIESGEDLISAAVREIREETGLLKEDLAFGPIVWFGEFEMVLSDELTKLKQNFIVARTKNKYISMERLEPEEKKVVEEIRWFNLKDIENCKEVIYPVLLRDYIKDILDKKYPEEPIWIDLAKRPFK